LPPQRPLAAQIAARTLSVFLTARIGNVVLIPLNTIVNGQVLDLKRSLQCMVILVQELLTYW
jgi:hypothetical protein